TEENKATAAVFSATSGKSVVELERWSAAEFPTIGNRAELKQTKGMATEAEPPPYYEPAIPFAEQRSKLRADFGRSVSAKLDTSPGLWRYSTSAAKPVQ